MREDGVHHPLEANESLTEKPKLLVLCGMYGFLEHDRSSDSLVKVKRSATGIHVV